MLWSFLGISKRELKDQLYPSARYFAEYFLNLKKRIESNGLSHGVPATCEESQKENWKADVVGYGYSREQSMNLKKRIER